jgi:hypothetical protein
MPREKRNEMPREKRDERAATGGLQAAKGGYPPTPPRRLGNKDADGQAILIATAHRPIAVPQMRKVLWGIWTLLPPRQKATLVVRQMRWVLRGLWTPLPPRQKATLVVHQMRVNVRLA